MPDPLTGRFPPEIVALHRAIKAIPDAELTAWMSLPLGKGGGRPDFLVVRDGGGAFLLAVCGAGQADVEEASGASLFRGGGGGFPGTAEAARVRQFVSGVRGSGNGHADVGPNGAQSTAAAGPVTAVVCYPHVAQAVLDAVPPGLRPEGVLLLGRERCQAKELAEFFRSAPSQAPDAESLALLRGAFNPESVVPRGFCPSAPRVAERNTEAALAPVLLDYDQEQWAKQRLLLSPEAAQVAEAAQLSGASLVTGVAGSGKSLVLLFRACTQARLAPQTRSLVLTHNKALRNELWQRFGELGKPPNVEWHTFYSWIWPMVEARRPGLQIVQYQDRERLIAGSAEPFFAGIKPEQVVFLGEEFDWMQDRGLVREEEYLGAGRAGRGVALGREARRKVFAAFRAYRAALEQSNREDWSGLALLCWNLVQSGEITPLRRQFIYIDEAQFFAPVWFRIIGAALDQQTGQIHLAADPTQGFLKRGGAWSEAGLDLRGRSTRLRRSYRSTRQILAFAARFYAARQTGDTLPDLNLPGEEELARAPEGPEPFVLRLTARQDELLRAANEIRQMLGRGALPEDILVIEAGSRGAAQVIQFLEGALGSGRAADARETPPAGAAGRVRVCGINAATGLEAPVVFVIGAAEMLEAEGAYSLKPEARAELVRDNTRRLYMAFTRAARSLVVTWAGGQLPHWLEAEGAGD